MEYIEKNAVDEGIKDLTENFFEDDEMARIRLTKGFSIQELAAEDGIIFEPEMDDNGTGTNQEEYNRNYFGNEEEDISKMMNARRIDEDSDNPESDDETPEYERLRGKMTPVTQDGGVVKRILATGLECHGKVPPGATVTIDYSMSLEAQDEPFDSSVLRGRKERYKLGEGRLIQGLDVAIQSMKKGEKSQFLIYHQYAFGLMGCPPRVPAEAVILCVVELIDFVEEGVAEALLAIPPEERSKVKTYKDIEKAARLEHVNGNNYVHKEEWQMAMKHYERGIRLLVEVNLKDEEQEKEQRRLLMKLNLNKAHCCIKIHWPKKACIACKEALDIDPQNTKALFRFGKAKRMLEDYQAARDLLVKAQRGAPQDKSINAELRSLEEQMARAKKDEKMLYQNMFGEAAGNQNEKVDDQFMEMIHEELTMFSQQEETSMPLAARFNALELKCVKATAASLGMEVIIRNGTDGSRSFTVVKKNKK